MTLLRDRIMAGTVVGVGRVSAGVLAVAISRTIAASGLIAAVTAGLLTANDTIADAHAILIAPSPMTFVR